MQKDTEIGYTFGGLTLVLVNFVGCIIMCVYSTSFYVMIPIGVFLISSYFLQRYIMIANREVYRLEGITKSPVLSYFTESLNGLPTIRSYRKI